MIILLVLAAVATATPIAAAVLVSIASMREDAEHSLTGRAPGWVTAFARRLLRAGSVGTRRAVPPLPRRRRPDNDDVAGQVPRPRTPDYDDVAWPLAGPHA